MALWLLLAGRAADNGPVTGRTCWGVCIRRPVARRNGPMDASGCGQAASGQTLCVLAASAMTRHGVVWHRCGWRQSVALERDECLGMVQTGRRNWRLAWPGMWQTGRRGVSANGGSLAYFWRAALICLAIGYNGVANWRIGVKAGGQQGRRRAWTWTGETCRYRNQWWRRLLVWYSAALFVAAGNPVAWLAAVAGGRG